MPPVAYSTYELARGGAPAVAWLLRRRASGDVLLTTRLALRAVWWYGRVPTASAAGGGTLDDGTPIVEAFLAAPRDCRPEATATVFTRHTRALLYFGFRFDDVRPHFDDLLLDRASAFGRVVEYREFSSRGAATVVEIGLPQFRPPRPARFVRGACHHQSDRHWADA
ncbi:MAG: hypothetical protein OEW19_03380 [Acidobacteriota bacterium]|nr:hypothetical protein [Acidobacteriota bacterium]